ncbi:hypothetical protein XENOCAPTIV_015454 [Xenoophorus captivus]|uniref:Uncharacterized protein n=1 Tax=Xenoophorus captivus TaxID=1517983 RepID=A0ABV0R8U5_9TELE
MVLITGKKREKWGLGGGRIAVVDGGRGAWMREEDERVKKALLGRAVNGSDEREGWTLKICVCVCMSASSEQTHYPSMVNKNCQACPQIMITSSVLYKSQLMLLHSVWFLDAAKK